MDDDDTLPDRYTERAAETLAYRLMTHLRDMEILNDCEVSMLRHPSWEQIEDAEAALKD